MWPAQLPENCDSTRLDRAGAAAGTAGGGVLRRGVGEWIINWHDVVTVPGSPRAVSESFRVLVHPAALSGRYGHRRSAPAVRSPPVKAGESSQTGFSPLPAAGTRLSKFTESARPAVISLSLSQSPVLVASFPSPSCARLTVPPLRWLARVGSTLSKFKRSHK
jgi:hypothetical protein